jgi:hypothetical protein
MASNQGKIDRLEKVILDLAESFKTIEDRQQDMIRNHIETSAATIIAAFRKQLEEIEKSLLIIAEASYLGWFFFLFNRKIICS